MAEDDPFDSVVFAEDRLHKEGYVEGLSKGKDQGHRDGFAAGCTKGAELGIEMGFYIGFTQDIISRLPKSVENEKKLRALTSLDEMVKGFQYLDISSPDYQTTLSQIRAKFSQVLSLLQISQSVHPYKQQSEASLNF